MFIFLLFITLFNLSCSDNELENADNSGTFTDTRDNHIYKWVKIGDQIWMAENLAYLPEVDSSKEFSYTEPRYYVLLYDFPSSVSEAKTRSPYETYGVLYNWPAALSSCPSGWHLPTDDEWKRLEMAIGMSKSEADDTGWRGTYEGTKLKAFKSWDYNMFNTDDFGFSALPGGYRRSSVSNGGGLYGYWWSATEASSSNVWTRELAYNSSKVGRSSNYGKEYGYSVRCVRD